MLYSEFPSCCVEYPHLFCCAVYTQHHHYKVACALCPSAIDVCNGGNILQEKGCEVCQHQSCFKLNSNVPAE